MPAEKGGRGRDQPLDVEVLPPRDLLRIRKVSCRKERLPSLAREAVEACGSAARKGERGVRGPSSATVTHTHTQDLVSISGRDF